MIHALERILRLGGYMPITFPCAEAVLEQRVAANPACLVLDVHLPGLTGFELYERLAREGPPPPVIFITAYDDQESRAQAEKLGAVAYLAKPFSGHDLVAAIMRVTGSPLAKPVAQ